MKIIIVGGGVIGVTSAWYLARAGHEVVVLERQPAVALETSHANAGQISVGYSAPWAAPGIPLKALHWLMQRHAPLALYPDGTLFQWQWLSAMLRQCTAQRYAINKSRMLQLARYSQQCLHALIEETGVNYEGRRLGTLQLFRTAQQLDQAQKDVALLQRHGMAHALLDVHGCVAREPALAAQTHKIAGGLYLPGDETGDCRLFTLALAEQARTLGVRFLFNQEVIAFRQDTAGRLSAACTVNAEFKADAFVIAGASFSRPLLSLLGLHVPVYPVKGYSVTVPLADPEMAPLSTVMDETYKVAMTRFDQRVRVGGIAELAGMDKTLRPHRLETLRRVVNDWFPHCGTPDVSTFWCGLRPMLPDGTPLVSATPMPNLWVNTGHGTLGWTMACGSAALLADLVNGTPPALEHDGYALKRDAS